MASETTETFLVPGLFVVQHAAFGQWFPALRATLGVQILITSGTVELLILRNETAGPNGFLTDRTLEALFMPVGAIVFQARAARLNSVMTSYTRLLKVGDVAIITQDLLLVEGEFAV